MESHPPVAVTAYQLAERGMLLFHWMKKDKFGCLEMLPVIRNTP